MNSTLALKEERMLKYGFMGYISGLVMESFTHPLSTIRTRMKANKEEYLSFRAQTQKMYRAEGIKSYFRGMSCSFGCSFSYGPYFFLYEWGKKFLHQKYNVNSEISSFCSSFIAMMFCDIAYIPFSVVRTRMQIEPGVFEYRNVWDGLKKIKREEGFQKLFLGTGTQMVHDALEFGLMMGFYELFSSQDKETTLFNSLINGLGATCLATLVCNPLEVFITRVQSEPTKLFDIIKNIHRKEGFSGYMKGLPANIAHSGLVGIFLFPTYEYLKLVYAHQYLVQY